MVCYENTEKNFKRAMTGPHVGVPYSILCEYIFALQALISNYAEKENKSKEPEE